MRVTLEMDDELAAAAEAEARRRRTSLPAVCVAAVRAALGAPSPTTESRWQSAPPASDPGGQPSSVEEVWTFLDQLRSHPNHVGIEATRHTWTVLRALLRLPGMRGNHITDAYLATPAISSGATLVTSDRGFSRFPGLA